MPIKLLSEDSYRGSSKGAVISDGESGHTHIALIQVDDDHPAVRCYVKFYPDLAGSGEHRGLVNELVGHVLGSFLGAAVPARAGFIAVRGDQLADLPAWATIDSQLVGWWTQDQTAPSLRAHYDLSDRHQTNSVIREKLKAALAELLKSAQLHQILALDELIANIDRNIGNLLRIKTGDYLLIDHGMCLTGEAWQPDDLKPYLSYDNKIAFNLRPASLQLPFKHATVKAHETLTTNIEPAIQALLKWLPVAVDAAECSAIEHFIRTRAGRSNLPQRLGLFI